MGMRSAGGCYEERIYPGVKSTKREAEKEMNSAATVCAPVLDPAVPEGVHF